MITKRRRAVDEGFGTKVEPREAERQPPASLKCRRLVPGHSALAAEEHLARRKRELESQHGALGPGLRANEGDAGAGQRLELALEVFLLRRVGPRDADRSGRAWVGGHSRENTPLWPAVRHRVSASSEST